MQLQPLRLLDPQGIVLVRDLAGGGLHHLHSLRRRQADAVGDVLVALLGGRGVQVEMDLVLVHCGVDLGVHDGRMIQVLLLVVWGVVIVVVGIGVGPPVVGAVVVVGVARRYHGFYVGFGAVEDRRRGRRGQGPGDELVGTGVWKN